MADPVSLPADRAALYHQLRLEDGRRCKEAAKLYLAMGWSVLPLCPPDHFGVGKNHGRTCPSPGKRPWIDWKEYQERLPTEADIDYWWSKQPLGNVGAALGEVSGIIRIDVDGAAGEARLQEMSKGDLPPTLEFTGNPSKGSRGLIYKVPTGIRLRTTNQTPKKGEELRFQAKGAQTALPPSRHPDWDGYYAWAPGHGPGEIEMALMPDWLVRHMVEDQPTPSNQPHQLNGQHAPEDGAELVINESREPPLAKYRELMEKSKVAAQAFERQRRQADMSTSAQDYTLALCAASQDWSPQEIVDLLIFCRKCNKEPSKCGHPSYYKSTVGAAVKKERQDNAVAKLTDAGDNILGVIRELTGIDVVRVVEHRTQPLPTYRLVLADAQVPIGTACDLRDQGRFRWTVFGATKKFPEEIKKKAAWEAVVANIVASAEPEEADEEADDTTAVSAWLRDYLLEYPPHDKVEEAMTNGRPFEKDGATWFFLRGLREWLRTYRQQKMSTKALSSMIGAAGCKGAKQNYQRKTGARTSCYVWSVPSSVIGVQDPNSGGD